jgi:hypothetical protein
MFFIMTNLAGFYPRLAIVLVSLLWGLPLFVEPEFHSWKALIAIAAASYILRCFEVALVKIALENTKNYLTNFLKNGKQLFKGHKNWGFCLCIHDEFFTLLSFLMLRIYASVNTMKTKIKVVVCLANFHQF